MSDGEAVLWCSACSGARTCGARGERGMNLEGGGTCTMCQICFAEYACGTQTLKCGNFVVKHLF